MCVADGSLLCRRCSYLALMRSSGVQEWIYNEIKAVNEMRFRFQQDMNAADYAQQLSSDMLVYRPEHTLSGGYLMASWEPRLGACTINPHL